MTAVNHVRWLITFMNGDILIDRLVLVEMAHSAIAIECPALDTANANADFLAVEWAK